MSKHQRGSKKGEFCTVAAKGNCECGNNYRDVCKGKTYTSVAYTYDVLENRKKRIRRLRVTKPFNAHHVLPVSCVESALQNKKGIKLIIRETVWCINAKGNMIALPLWGHTVKWYCNPATRGRGAPPFANWPQHDVHHNKTDGYCDEVIAEIKKIAKDVKQAKHSIDPADIASALRAESKKFKQKLKSRGQRSGGTHQAWKNGTKGQKDWELPFSMASTVEFREFPLRDFDERKADWIDRLAHRLLRR